MSGGECDMEIDTYMFDRNTGNQSETGSFLDKDITVRVYDLNGIAAWGQRNTNHTINLYFENCKNMNRIYFTNTANEKGSINVTLSGCSFDADQGAMPIRLFTATPPETFSSAIPRLRISPWD